MSAGTILICADRMDGKLKASTTVAGLTPEDARALLWEALKDLTPGVQK